MADSAKFSQSHGIVPLITETLGDYNAGFTADSINMAKYNHCTIICLGEDDLRGAGVLTIMGGTSDAAVTAAITFTYRYISVDVKAAGADQLSDPATSAALSFTEAYLRNGMYVIEFDTEDMNVGGVQYTFATPVVDATGTAGTMNMVAILSGPRYAKATMPTAIPV